MTFVRRLMVNKKHRFEQLVAAGGMAVPDTMFSNSLFVEVIFDRAEDAELFDHYVLMRALAEWS